MSLVASAVASPAIIPTGNQCCKQHIKHISFIPLGLKPFHAKLELIEGRRRSSQGRHFSIICSAVLNARCAAEGQTQTVTRQSSTITVAPSQGKEKSPELDDGGAGLPPRDDDGGGGGGGGGGNWSGGFFFFGFLALLGLLKDRESEGPYQEDRR
ncbi:unnamed protein product [Cuscuta campestris]|uniref:Uncharacterized protein n=1 Tax=Cuscuta campestris TaxID=132261 RepID=A0A484K5E9_9ASTE|nr:unnamed protein product [Cuscuta campestris]